MMKLLQEEGNGIGSGRGSAANLLEEVVGYDEVAGVER